MRLKYKILWIENEEDWVDSIYDQIQEHLSDLGFEFEKKLIAKEEESVIYDEYDLILMDLNLAEQPNGAELIERIRNLNVFTDIVFYSSIEIELLREKGREKNLEGVYYSGRTPDSSFVRKVCQVIDSTIKKVQDLSNLRGLVMAEVSDLDSLMDEIIQKYYVDQSLLDEFHHIITKDKEKNIKKSLDIDGIDCEKACKLNWRQLNIDKLLKIIDSSQKVRAINILLERNKKQGTVLYQSSNEKGFVDNYNKDIIDVRNNLAHCSSIIENGKEILKTRNGDLIFDTDRITEIRKKIREYHELFLKIKEL